MMKRVLIVVLLLLLLSGCASAPKEAEPTPTPELPHETAAPPAETPAPTATPEPVTEDGLPVYEVYDVDGLLEALGGGREIVLHEGVYNLSRTKNYGYAGENYFWVDNYDGYGLALMDLDDLRLRAAEGESVSLVSEPRYADVLSFFDCEGLRLSDLTLGHTPEQGACVGDVLGFTRCEDAEILSCDLYGCGALGFEARDSRALRFDGCTLRDCSYGACYALRTQELVFENGTISGCGEPDGGYQLLEFEDCKGITFKNSVLRDNRVQLFLSCDECEGLSLLGCRIKRNIIFSGMLRLNASELTVASCGFEYNELESGQWYLRYGGDRSPVKARDAEGRSLSESDLAAMLYEAAE